EGILGGAYGSEGVRVRVHFVVAQELEQRTVILIGAGLGEHVDLRSLPAELCRIDPGLYLELLQCVDGWHHDECIEIGVRIFDAIQRIVIEVGALPGQGNRLRRAKAALPRTGLSLTREAGGNVGSQRNQLKIVAAVERQFHNASVLDDSSYRGV